MCLDELRCPLSKTSPKRGSPNEIKAPINRKLSRYRSEPDQYQLVLSVCWRRYNASHKV